MRDFGGSVRRTTSLIVAVCGTVAAGLVAAPPGQAAPAGSPLVLELPSQVTRTSVGGKVAIVVAPTVKAVGTNVEFWSTRPRWNRGVITEVRTDSGQPTVFPADPDASLRELPDFFRLRIRDVSGRSLFHQNRGACLNEAVTSRRTTDGPDHVSYPYECPRLAFATGSVQGVARGWANTVPVSAREPIALSPGTYRLTVAITGKYRSALGISEADGIKTTDLVVVRDQGGDAEPHSLPRRVSRTPHTEHRAVVAGPAVLPNLRALPAFAIRVTGRGNELSFESTVWNRGPGQLVVSGAPAAGVDTTPAMQHFYDAAGNDAGTTPVGEFTWGSGAAHRHWHHVAPARYRLLDSDDRVVRRIDRAPECLDDTDPVDATVSNAAWRFENAHPQTSCADRGAALEVLDSGIGDTGLAYGPTSFDLRGLPNGTYRVAVTADPRAKLVETHDDDNVSTRTVRIGGRSGHRTVTVVPKGLVRD